MLVVRSVRIDDLDRLAALTRRATQGLTSLQLDRNALLDRIEQSVFAFSRTSPTPRGEPFVLVMEDGDNGELVGTSTVYAKTGGYQPFYVYRRIESAHVSAQLDLRATRQYLELTRIHDGPTEIGSLFLRRKYRGAGHGRWLSLARFALIAMYRHRFADRVIAEMRGLALEDGRVPFWEAVTGRFLPIDFKTADAASTMSKQFIEELMPKHPIYLDLLPRQVRDSIGAVHPETERAYRLLLREGFRPTDLVDIFDAGPTIAADVDAITAVQRCRGATVGDLVDHTPPPGRDGTIVISKRDGWTSVLTPQTPRDDRISLSPAEAARLDLQPGDRCFVLTM